MPFYINERRGPDAQNTKIIENSENEENKICSGKQPIKGKWVQRIEPCGDSNRTSSLDVRLVRIEGGRYCSTFSQQKYL